MSLRQTPLADRHAARDATVTEFGGWEMPVSFAGIGDEHAAVRDTVGVFDVSHMGEIVVSGADAATLCQRLTTNDVRSLSVGQAQYSTVTNTDGVILDDVIIYRVDEATYLFVPNAGKDEWMADRWRDHRKKWELTATVQNRTEEYGMLAVQGPDAVETMADAGCAVDELETMTITETTIADVDCWVARTGYTGEDGFEILAPWDETKTVDEAIDGTRCGLGARDTLRLEMGFALAGNEFDVESNPRTPLEVGLGFVVSFDASPPFVGFSPLQAQKETGTEDRLVGLVLEERGVPRHGYAITDADGDRIGEVTSGTMSPTLGEPIALGYVTSTVADRGGEVGVEIRGSAKKARIVTPPFISRER